MSDRLRVAMFTPLPPSRTGTAEYARDLIGHLGKLVELTVFESAPRRPDLRPYDAVFYQIANNPHHADIYRMALEHPAIAVLHEVNLHDLLKGETLYSGNERAYLKEVIYEIFGRDLEGRDLEATVEVPQPRTFTVLRRLLERSSRCVVHSHAAERELRLKGFRGPVAVIPHGASVRQLDARRYRQSLGLDAASPLIGVFGYQRPDKRGLEGFRVFQKLLAWRPNAHLLVLGEPHPEVKVHEWIAQSGLARQIHVLGFQPMEDFDGYLAACDVVLNLRHPTFGETSGTMMRAFGLGRTVIVSDTGAFRETPDDVCLRVAPDEHEEPVLLECLRWLLDDPTRTEAIGRRAQQWVAEQCSWERVAQLYAEVAQSAAEGGSSTSGATAGYSRDGLGDDAIFEYLSRWVQPESEGAGYFRTHAHRFVRTLQKIPPGGAGERILEMGCYLQITPALRSLLGYAEVRGCALGPAGESIRGRAVSSAGEEFEWVVDLFNAEFDVFPYPDGYFSTVVCGELLEHLEKDPMHLMGEIHRILKPGGALVLTTPNIVSLRAVGAVLKGAHPASFGTYSHAKPDGVTDPGHSREYTPNEIRLLLGESGFTVVEIETGPYGAEAVQPECKWVLPALQSLHLDTAMRGDCIYALGRKESLPRGRFPAWLYCS